jgi:adenine-specific DNA-methyltransferase
MTNKKQKLGLTWIGKDKRPKLEPRILLEDPSKSYHAKHKVSENDQFDNKLIFGDNLLALKALEQEYTGKVKCIYIDPPFNTGSAFTHYDDGLEHSIWLDLMRKRMDILHRLLAEDGCIFVHLDDNELDYLKVLMDEVFLRENFINRITIEARSPSAFSTVNAGVFKASEYILWYAKNKKEFLQPQKLRVRRSPDYAYNKWLLNPEDDCGSWEFISIQEAFDSYGNTRSRRPDTLLESFNKFIIENSHRVCRLASISDAKAGAEIVVLKQESLKVRGKVLLLKRDLYDDVYVLDGQQIIFYSKNVVELDGELSASSPLTNIWTDVAWEGIAGEGGVTFNQGKKPERLIKRCLELSTLPGDLVLDSFGGSGTTGAVAHKMGRRWIMVELGEHCHTHIIPRLQKVIDGTDQGGISKAVNWQGGGGFRYYKVAPSLLEKDRWGQWIINREYNAAMLAEALCKLEGFSYAPSDTEFWNHGYSTENDRIYVTTQSLTLEQLQAISEEVGNQRTLLICCSAFRAKPDQFANLTLKKIPKMVLNKCEWAHDDYSLNVENLPMQAPDPEPAQTAQKPSKTAQKQPGLVDEEAE